MANDRGARRARDTPASPAPPWPIRTTTRRSCRPEVDSPSVSTPGPSSASCSPSSSVRSSWRRCCGASSGRCSSSRRSRCRTPCRSTTVSWSRSSAPSSVVRSSVFADPGGWLSGVVPTERGPVGRALEFVGVLPDTSTEHLIKRAVGMPGDHVVCCDAQGRITVNDVPAGRGRPTSTDRPTGWSPIPRRSASTWSCRPTASSSSATTEAPVATRAATSTTPAPGQVKGENAFVPLDLVVGRAIAVAWPVGDAHRLPIPATYAGVPAPVEPAPVQPVVQAGPEASC